MGHTAVVSLGVQCREFLDIFQQYLIKCALRVKHILLELGDLSSAWLNMWLLYTFYMGNVRPKPALCWGSVLNYPFCKMGTVIAL